MTQPKLSHISKKMPLIGPAKFFGSGPTRTAPTISEDISRRLGANVRDLGNANALIVYLAGKSLTTLRPMTLLDSETNAPTLVPAGTELKLLDRQPLHRRAAWQPLHDDWRVNMEYRGRPVLLTLKCFHDIFCLGFDHYAGDEAFD